MSLLDAFVHTKKCRRIISPNFGFLQQLISYEFSIHGKNSVTDPEQLFKYEI